MRTEKMSGRRAILCYLMVSARHSHAGLSRDGVGCRVHNIGMVLEHVTWMEHNIVCLVPKRPGIYIRNGFGEWPQAQDTRLV